MKTKIPTEQLNEMLSLATKIRNNAETTTDSEFYFDGANYVPSLADLVGLVEYAKLAPEKMLPYFVFLLTGEGLSIEAKAFIQEFIDDFIEFV